MSAEALGDRARAGRAGASATSGGASTGASRVNAGGYVGHSAVRRFVMGDDASVRAARPDEIEAMRDLVRDAMREGALGFCSSQLDIHVAHDGREVPSNHAAPEELVALAARAGRVRRGALEFIPRSFVDGLRRARTARCCARWPRASGKPIELHTLTPLLAAPDRLAASRSSSRATPSREGIPHPPDVPDQQAGCPLRARLDLPVRRVPDASASALTLPPGERERRAARSGGARRRCGASSPTRRARAFVFAWEILSGRVRARPRARGVGRPDGGRARRPSAAQIRSTASSTWPWPTTSPRRSSSRRRMAAASSSWSRRCCASRSSWPAAATGAPI